MGQGGSMQWLRGWALAGGCAWGVLAAGAAATTRAAVAVQDDSGVWVRLERPARRIVSLAPHITENLFAAGAGQRLVGVVDYSDYPAQAQILPQVGSYAGPDLERILGLRPDLVVAWQSGNPPGTLARLKALGIPVFLSQPDRLDEIASNIERLGHLAGTDAVASQVARTLQADFADLRRRYGDKAKVRVFYQLWHQPLLTAGGGQIINEAISLCGGDNVFARLPDKAPTVSVESVVAANPDVIVASGMGRETPIGLDGWRQWRSVNAVARGHLFVVLADLMQRPTARLQQGTAQLCEWLDRARRTSPAR